MFQAGVTNPKMIEHSSAAIFAYHFCLTDLCFTSKSDVSSLGLEEGCVF